MDFSAERIALIQNLRTEIRDERVLKAMARVPREEFIPAGLKHAAYVDRAFPIGSDQTISQPTIVAMMTEALELKGQEKVLEVGTGSGYQTAIIAEIADKVVTVERHRELLEGAQEVLTRLGYGNIEFHLSTDVLGWPEGAPYDAIVVTAGAPSIPQGLLDQLTFGGRLVIPVGSRYEQDLVRLTRHRGECITRSLGACRFVPLIGEGAWSE